MSFDVAVRAQSSDIPNPNTDLLEQFMVVVSTDGGKIWKAEDATVWSTDIEGDYNFNNFYANGKFVTMYVDRAIGVVTSQSLLPVDIILHYVCHISIGFHVDHFCFGGGEGKFQYIPNTRAFRVGSVEETDLDFLASVVAQIDVSRVESSVLTALGKPVGDV